MQSKSTYCFLYEKDLRHEKIKGEHHNEICLRLASGYLKVFGERSSKNFLPKISLNCTMRFLVTPTMNGLS